MNKQFYVYSHVRPDTNSIFYIGIGSDIPGKYSRAYEFGLSKRNTIWNNIWLKNNKQIIVNILQIFDNQEDCFQTEIFLIKKYGRICNNTGILSNISAGGEHKNADSRKIIQYDLSGKFICIWNNMFEIIGAINIKSASIYANLNKKSYTAGGFIWMWYSEDYLQIIPIDYINKNKKKIYQFDKQCNYINTYKSVFEAGKITKIDYASIIKVINNQRKTAGGFIWSYNNICSCYYKNKIGQYSLDGILIKIHDNLQSATKSLGLSSRTAIKNCFIGKQKQAYGYLWKHIEE